MKTIQITLLVLCTFAYSAMKASTPIDTTIVNYNFNNLNAGNLNTQDGWLTTKHNTTSDFQVVNASGYDLTKALGFSQSGPSVGVDASRSFASLFGNTGFSNTSSTYIVTFDVLRSYWGVEFAIAADLDNNGKITNSDIAEKALIFNTSSVSGMKLTLPNGTVTTYPAAASIAWTTFEITLSNFSSTTSGNISIRSKELGTSTWNTLVSTSALGIDTTATTKKNPSLWKFMFFHNEGSNGKIDNLSITRIGPQIITAIPTIESVTDVKIYPNPSNGLITISLKALSPNTYLFLHDMAGREIKKIKIERPKQTISLFEIPAGVYMYQLQNDNEISKTGKLILNRE